MITVFLSVIPVVNCNIRDAVHISLYYYSLCRGRPRVHVAGQRVVGVLKVARGRRSTSMVSVSTVSYRRPWSVGSVPRHLIFHAVIRV